MIVIVYQKVLIFVIIVAPKQTWGMLTSFFFFSLLYGLNVEWQNSGYHVLLELNTYSRPLYIKNVILMPCVHFIANFKVIYYLFNACANIPICGDRKYYIYRQKQKFLVYNDVKSGLNVMTTHGINVLIN